MPVWDRKYVTAVCLIWSEIPSGIWASQPCLRMSNPVWGEDFTKSYVQCTVNCLSSDTSHNWRIEGQRKGLEDVVDNRHDWRGVLQGGLWLWDFMTRDKNLSVEMEIEEEEGDHGLHKNGLKMKTTVTRIYKKEVSCFVCIFPKSDENASKQTQTQKGEHRYTNCLIKHRGRKNKQTHN